MKIKRSYVIAGLIIVVLAILLWAGRSLFVAAVVDGQPVSRLAVVQEAEKQSGRQALDNLIRNTLIEAEAREKNVSVTEEEIDQEIQKIEGTLAEQGQQLDEVLSVQGMTRDDLRNLVRLDKLVGKLVGDDITVADEEVTEYIEANQEVLPEDQTEEEQRDTIRERLKQQKLNEAVQQWLSDLQENADIDYWVSY